VEPNNRKRVARVWAASVVDAQVAAILEAKIPLQHHEHNLERPHKPHAPKNVINPLAADAVSVCHPPSLKTNARAVQRMRTPQRSSLARTRDSATAPPWQCGSASRVTTDRSNSSIAGAVASPGLPLLPRLR
jgi:hypothetical protein